MSLSGALAQLRLCVCVCVAPFRSEISPGKVCRCAARSTLCPYVGVGELYRTSVQLACLHARTLNKGTGQHWHQHSQKHVCGLLRSILSGCVPHLSGDDGGSDAPRDPGDRTPNLLRTFGRASCWAVRCARKWVLFPSVLGTIKL